MELSSDDITRLGDCFLREGPDGFRTPEAVPPPLRLDFEIIQPLANQLFSSRNAFRSEVLLCQASCIVLEDWIQGLQEKARKSDPKKNNFLGGSRFSGGLEIGLVSFL